jgi:hypothetical protein
VRYSLSLSRALKSEEVAAVAVMDVEAVVADMDVEAVVSIEDSP